jgi:hypothetical protein
MASTKGSSTKPKQTKLPGTVPPRIAAIDRAADAYVDVRDERMKLTKTETERKSALIVTMKQAGQRVYRGGSGSDVYVVTLIEGAEKVKVSRAGENGDGE